jgi:hypothetical protein
MRSAIRFGAKSARPTEMVEKSQSVERDQRELPLAGPSDKGRSPNIRRNRFARCKELTCFQDAARSESVKGNAMRQARRTKHEAEIPQGDGIPALS